MTYEAYASHLQDEVHRYFPEWADRPDSAGPLLEADRNSYLAGGYSEEFGYRVRPDHPPVFPLLIGDPECSREWGVQSGCLHPGYPECPRPADRGTHPERVGTISFDAESPGAHERRTALHPPDDVNGPPDANRHVGITRIVRVDQLGLERHPASRVPIMRFWARLRIRSRLRDRGI